MDGQSPQRRHLFIISAPSGGGKTTVCRAVLDRFADMLYSVSYTTRKPRSGEREGVDYHFIDRDEFEAGIANRRWAEWAEVHGHYYGTSAAFLDQGLAAGRDILLDIDVQGTRQILSRYPDSVTVFLRPPSLEVLKMRLESRGTDSPQTIAVRLENAKEEMASQNIYQYSLVNDRLPDTIAALLGIIAKHRGGQKPLATQGP
ncbi:MAG: guanylate kinase [Desulfobacterales bacterium]|nr:MAG: guanylate kinase [Desulfobacterales bacterium]